MDDDEIIDLAEAHGLGRSMRPIGVQTGKVFHDGTNYRTAELLNFVGAVIAADRAALPAAAPAAVQEALAQLRHLVDDLVVCYQQDGLNRFMVREGAGLMFSNMVSAAKKLLAAAPDAPAAVPDISAWAKARFGVFHPDGRFEELPGSPTDYDHPLINTARWVGGYSDMQLLRAVFAAAPDTPAAQPVEPSDDARDAARWRELVSQMTFYNVGESDGPVLAAVSKRIWYHATDDLSYPLAAVVDAALSASKEKP
jgi:hypothetical protein